MKLKYLPPLFYPVASGIFYALSFPRIEIHLVAWIALVPLLIAIRNETPRRAFYRGWLAGGVAFLALLYWVTITMAHYGKLPWLATLPILLLLVTYMGLYLAGFAALVVWIRSKMNLPGVLLVPTVWTALEWIRGHALTGFPWALLGYSQYRNLPLIQIADLTGVYGVSFLIVLVNAAIADGLMLFNHRQRRKASLSLLTAIVVVGFALGYGYWRLSQPDLIPTRSLRVGVVQGNIPQDIKWDSRYRQETLHRYMQLTHTVAQKGLDLAVWPEAAMPFIFEDDLFFQQQVVTLAQQDQTPILFGSPARMPIGESGKREADRGPLLSNSAYLLDAAGRVVSRYDKIHLVPFGEYVPLSPLLFFINKMVEGIGEFVPGNRYTVMTLPKRETSTNDIQQRADASVGKGEAPSGFASGGGMVAPPKIGVVICFEVIFPELVRRFVQEGADIMITITNDAWFGSSSAPYQHFSMVVFRSIENRVPFVRAANTGISGFIEASGRIRHATDLFTEAALTDTVRPTARRTVYTRLGDLFAEACGIITLVLVFWRKSHAG